MTTTYTALDGRVFNIGDKITGIEEPGAVIGVITRIIIHEDGDAFIYFTADGLGYAASPEKIEVI